MSLILGKHHRANAVLTEMLHALCVELLPHISCYSIPFRSFYRQVKFMLSPVYCSKDSVKSPRIAFRYLLCYTFFIL